MTTSFQWEKVEAALLESGPGAPGSSMEALQAASAELLEQARWMCVFRFLREYHSISQLNLSKGTAVVM